jgi:hypothetical protein
MIDLDWLIMTLASLTLSFILIWAECAHTPRSKSFNWGYVICKGKLFFSSADSEAKFLALVVSDLMIFRRCSFSRFHFRHFGWYNDKILAAAIFNFLSLQKTKVIFCCCRRR